MSNAGEIYGTTWKEKEYIIALHYYYLYKNEPQHADTVFVRELSEVLGRTPHSILYRLQNFASIDPDQTDPGRKGKSHITNYGKNIFEKWSTDKRVLKETAEAFLRDEKQLLQPDIFNPNPIKIPIAFKEYELLDEIGRGGFGVVCSCLNGKTDEVFAIKVIDSTKVFDRDCIGRFSREIRTLKSIQHPDIIQIHDDNLDVQRDYPAFIMDLADRDLNSFIEDITKSNQSRKRPILDPKVAETILKNILSAVLALHESPIPIIHRDINPSNILRKFDGSWALADFSLAKFLPPSPASTTFATKTHVGLGTAHYTSPEQYSNLKDADFRSDIFSLGWLLWELYSDSDPYPRKDKSGLPEKLNQVFQKATAYNKEDRFSSITEFRDASHLALSG